MHKIAIIGSARREIVGEHPEAAETAAQEIGKAFARAGYAIVVYSCHPDFIENQVIKGYVTEEGLEDGSIICCYPLNAREDFSILVQETRLLKEMPDPSPDWEVSFYQSLTQVDGVFLLGGGPSTLIAGHVARILNLPIVALAEFGGSAAKIWTHLAHDPNVNARARDAMARWTSQSPQDCVDVFEQEFAAREQKIANQRTRQAALEDEVKQWRDHQIRMQEQSQRQHLSIYFLLAAVLSLILGLILSGPSEVYTTLFISALTIAGGAGAAIRMLAPGPLETQNRNSIVIIGAAVGLVFSILYLIPQLIGDASFLDSATDKLPSTTRIQFMSAMVVSFMTGLGFDVALGQLLKKAQETGSEITTATLGRK